MLMTAVGTMTRSSPHSSPPQPHLHWPRSNYEACLPFDTNTRGPLVSALITRAGAPLLASQAEPSCAAAYQASAIQNDAGASMRDADTIAETCSASKSCPSRPQSRDHK